MRQRPSDDILITICISPELQSQEALGGKGVKCGDPGRGKVRDSADEGAARLHQLHACVPSLVPRCPGSPLPKKAEVLMVRHPDRSLPCSNATVATPGPRHLCPRAETPRDHTNPLCPSRLRCPNFLQQVQPAPLTLSRQLTFSVGYTTFPQRAHWGFMVAAPAGGGCSGDAAGSSEEPL